jgi:hypothetical protein
MRLNNEEEEIPDVTKADIERICADEGTVGKFVVLAGDDTGFTQAANDWQNSDECRAFMQRTGEEPFVLEYRDGPTGRLFRVKDWLTIAQVRMALLSYLDGGPDWRNLVWTEFHL